MSRGIARDRLTDDVAEQVRIAARKAKAIKRVTYEQIAAQIGTGWEARRVVDTLASGRPLRGAKAREVLAGLWNIPPRNAAASKLLREAWDLVGPPVHPPVVVPPWAFDHLAEYLADELSCKPDVGPKRRAAFRKCRAPRISRTAEDMALAFFDACWSRGCDATAGEVLKRFGYLRTLEKHMSKL